MSHFRVTLLNNPHHGRQTCHFSLATSLISVVVAAFLLMIPNCIWAQHPIVKDGKLAFIYEGYSAQAEKNPEYDIELDDKIILTGHDYIRQTVVSSYTMGSKILDKIWPEFMYPTETGYVTVPDITKIIWFIPIDTSFSIVNLQDSELNINYDFEYAAKYMLDGKVWMYDPETTGISYTLRERYTIKDVDTSGDEPTLAAGGDEFAYFSRYSEEIAFGSADVSDGWNLSMFDKEMRLIKSSIGKAGRMSEGLVRIKELGDDEYIYVDRYGQQAISEKYQYAEDFSSGRALVMQNGEWFYINRDGKKTISGFYESVGFSEGVSAIKKSEGWFIIDTLGKMLLNTPYQNAVAPSEGMIAVERNGS